MCATLFLARGLIMKTTVPCSPQQQEPKPIEVKKSLSVGLNDLWIRPYVLMCKLEDSPHKTHQVKEKDFPPGTWRSSTMGDLSL